MAKLISFNFLTANGFFHGPNGDISWHKDNDEEKDEYAGEGVKSESILLFGRVTYQMMAGFWPTPQAMAYKPELAKGMNRMEKIVFSKTLDKASWNNSRVIKNNIVEEVQKLKQSSPKHLTILGSGSIITQFAEEGLIDEFQFMIDPLVTGSGTPLFSGIKNKLDLKLVNSRIFKSGVVLLCYEPA